jgi:hypothetical protein
MNLTMKDGTRLLLHQKADADGDYYEVAEPGGMTLGTIRLADRTKSDCTMIVPTADRYFVEIVKQLRDRGF